MAVANRLDNVVGINTTNNSSGTSIGKDAGNAGFLPFKADSVPTYTSATTLSQRDSGLIYVSGTAGVVAITMASASLMAGAMIVVRNLSADAHTLSSSDPGAKVFCAPSGSTATTGAGSGGKITMAAVSGSSVVLFCDGQSYCVVGGSGSVVYSGTG